eukprot:11585891-Alexandrium_andersonii.AAC.1
MSASLVGSEMCIRDSCSRGGLPPPRIPPKDASGFAPDALLGGVQGGRSVSYTHLTLPTICSV